MILSDSLILKALNDGQIVIDPFFRENLNPCTVDLTLNRNYKIYERVFTSKTDPFIDLMTWPLGSPIPTIKTDITPPLDSRLPNKTEEYVMGDEGVVLKPGELYLYSCNEKIGIKGNLRASVMGKSSLGRLGLDVHICAGYIDPGFEGSLVLEMRVVRPLRVYPNMKICQIEFAEVSGEILVPYNKNPGSKYMNQEGVVESRNHLNFNNEKDRSL